VNPLEIPPMGDCVLADVKREFGDRLALMGNLHTTETMLNGSPERVRRESLQAILDAGVGGGFVLSTGDQCGYNTPLENIFRMVETAKIYGVYPLDVEGIRSEIAKGDGKP
jgi:uroporphyrinogen decarboxylase